MSPLDNFPIPAFMLFSVFWLLAGFTPYALLKRGLLASELTSDGMTSILWSLGCAVSAAVFGSVAALINCGLGFRLITHWILLVILLGLGLYGFLSWKRQFTVSDLVQNRSHLSNGLLLLVILLPVLMIQIPAVTTPYIYGDDQHYHVSLISFWFQEGSFANTDFHSFYLFPLLSSQLAALFYPVFGIQAAKYVGYFQMLTGTILLYGMTLHLTRKKYLAVTAAFIFATLPMHFIHAFCAMDDRGIAFFALAGFSLLLLRFYSYSSKILLISLLLAAAAATKHHGMFVIVSIIPMMVIIYLLSEKNAGWTKKLAVLCLAAVIAAGALSPWYLRSYLATGNPVFPVKNAAESDQLTRNQATYWDKLLEREEYKPSLVKTVKSFYAFTSTFNNANTPVTLILLPLLILALIFRRKMLPAGWRQVAGGLIVFLILNTFFGVGRYRTVLYPVHAPLLLLCIVAVGTISNRDRSALLILMLSALCLWPQRWLLVRNASNAVRHFCGVQSRETYLTKYQAYGTDIVHFNKLLSQDERLGIVSPGFIMYFKGYSVLVNDESLNADSFCTKTSLLLTREDTRNSGTFIAWMDKHNLKNFIQFNNSPTLVNLEPSDQLDIIKGDKFALVKRR